VLGGSIPWAEGYLQRTRGGKGRPRNRVAASSAIPSQPHRAKDEVMPQSGRDVRS